MAWKQYFKPHILDRGFDYYCEGTVRMLRTDNNIITAVVHGTDDYDVEITFVEEKVIDMNCTCPHAEGGNYCKHMAAVLYKNDDNNITNESQHTESVADSAETLVSKASEDTVRKFLVGILDNDDKLLTRFKSLVCPEISPADMKKYKAQIDNIVRKYQGRSGFVDYHSASDFVRALDEFLYEDVQMMLDNECYTEAFELTNHVFITAGNTDMDDSGGGTGMLAEHCYEIWLGIIGVVDMDNKKSILTWFLDHLNGSVIDYMEEYIEQILMEEFSEDEFLRVKMNFIDKKVSDTEKSDDSWKRDYQSGRWAMNYISLLESNGSEWDDIEQYCKKHWVSSAVRKYFIDCCIGRKDYDKAIEALQESLTMDSSFKGLVSDHSMKLKETYRISGKNVQYLEQLWQLVTKHSPGNLQLYRELKSQYDEAEWHEVREKVFSALPPYSNIDKFFKEEGLYDRLLACVNSSFGLNMLREHKDVLKDHYPQELLRKYRDEVESMASRPSDRARYRELASILQSMKKIPGGDREVNDILLHWRMTYSNRPAMMDELRKL